MRFVGDPHVPNRARNAGNANESPAAQQRINVASHRDFNRETGDLGENVAMSVRRETLKTERKIAIFAALYDEAK
jgi:hypothetical protein